MTPKHLLDANVLIAMVVSEHEHHERVSRWAQSVGSGFALCPIVEGALVRFLVRVGETGATAQALLEGLHALPTITFVPDSISYCAIDLQEVRGHRQVTDSYLVGSAAHHGMQLITLDEALAQAHPDVAVLVDPLVD